MASLADGREARARSLFRYSYPPFRSIPYAQTPRGGVLKTVTCLILPIFFPPPRAGPRVVLVGPPGLGKTALGGLLAAALSVELVTAGDRRPHRGTQGLGRLFQRNLTLECLCHKLIQLCK